MFILGAYTWRLFSSPANTFTYTNSHSHYGGSPGSNILDWPSATRLSQNSVAVAASRAAASRAAASIPRVWRCQHLQPSALISGRRSAAAAGTALASPDLISARLMPSGSSSCYARIAVAAAAACCYYEGFAADVQQRTGGITASPTAMELKRQSTQSMMMGQLHSTASTCSMLSGDPRTSSNFVIISRTLRFTSPLVQSSKQLT